MRRTHPWLRASGLFLSAALVLAGCSTTGIPSSARSTQVAPLATAYLPPGSVCAANGDYVRQQPNGDFAGCFRVPAYRGSTDVVALQTYLSAPRASAMEPTTSVAISAPPAVALRIRTRTVVPGERVTVVGHLRGAPTSRQRAAATYATLCWGGCRGGLQEQGLAVRWLSTTTFRMNLVIPATAWLVTNGRAVSVHPLTSGRYQVGVACLLQQSGCALGPAEGRTAVTLRAPAEARCLGAQPCESLSLNPRSAPVGAEVHVTGWAPLSLEIGQPFGYALSVTNATLRRSVPSMSFVRSEKVGGFNVVLAPRVLHVSPGATWASLGRVHVRSSTFSGPSIINPASSPGHVAWCEPSRVVVTDARLTRVVPISTVRAALHGTVLSIPGPVTSSPQCDEVQLDPRYAASVYAGFTAGEGPIIPPLFLAPLYSTNAGRTWRVVPTPPGVSLADFGGFVTGARSVEALFNAPIGASRGGSPLGTEHGVVLDETTADGGLTWTSGRLGCPVSGPCVRFGPFQWGNCAMNSDPQALLIGSPSVSATVRWRFSSWVTSVNSCSTQQLVVVSPTELVLLDPSSQYAMRRSTDVGRTWSYVALPTNRYANYGPDSIPSGNSLALASDGSLFSLVASPSGQRQELFRLAPRATKWCRVRAVFEQPVAAAGLAGPLTTHGSQLMWSQVRYLARGGERVSRHVMSLARLQC